MNANFAFKINSMKRPYIRLYAVTQPIQPNFMIKY